MKKALFLASILISLSGLSAPAYCGGLEDLRVAVKDGKVETVRKWFAEYPSADLHQDAEGEALLVAAIDNSQRKKGLALNRVAIIELILKHTSETGTQDKIGKLALERAKKSKANKLEINKQAYSVPRGSCNEWQQVSRFDLGTLDGAIHVLGKYLQDEDYLKEQEALAQARQDKQDWEVVNK